MNHPQSFRPDPMTFGYYYGPSESGKDSGTSHQPSGPPLLDNNESDMLQNFFENPNNIDPNFLNSPHEYNPPQQPATSNPPIQGDHTQSWLYDSQRHGFSTASTAVMVPESGDSSREGYQDFARPDSHSGPTEDVYAAARLLHGNQQRHGVPEPDQTEISEALFPQAHRPAQRSSQQQQEDLGYQHQSGPYHNNSYPYGTVPGRNGTYEQQRPQSNPEENASSGSSTTRTGALRFGSDDKFRGHFQGRMTAAPDRELTSAMLSNMEWVHKATGAPVGQMFVEEGSANDPYRKRRRDDSEEDDQSSDEGRSRKHRKSRSKRGEDHDDEDDYEGGRRGRHRSSPGRKRKWSPSASKAPRENLTEEQKRSNHIQSEQKRRNLIKQGFEDLTRMVPELRVGGYSKSNMLLEAAKFIRSLEEQNAILRTQLQGLDNG